MSLSIQVACSLLPSIMHIESGKALALSRILTTITQRALIALQEGSLSQFDAPVGDNSCKIRAAKIADIAEKVQNDARFSREVRTLLEQLEDIQDRLSEVRAEDSKQKMSLAEFREHCSIEFSLPKELCFLVQAHFLVRVKKLDTYDKTDPDLLCKIAPIAISTAKNWIHQIKVQIAEESVTFVREEAGLLDVPRKTVLQKMLNGPFLDWSEKRPILSNLHSMEVLFLRALKNRRFVVFKIEQWLDTKRQNDITFLAQPDSAANTFVPKKVEPPDLRLPAIILECRRVKSADDPITFTEIQQRFEQENLLELILASAAQDPQYLEGAKDKKIPFESCMEDLDIREEAERFQRLNEMAIAKGVARANPLLFAIQHIFCDQVGNIMRTVVS